MDVRKDKPQNTQNTQAVIDFEVGTSLAPKKVDQRRNPCITNVCCILPTVACSLPSSVLQNPLQQ